jgi:hypothetical protein
MREGALEWETIGMWRGSITPLRGTSSVSCTEVGVVKATQNILVRHAATTTTTHSRTGLTL